MSAIALLGEELKRRRGWEFDRGQLTEGRSDDVVGLGTIKALYVRVKWTDGLALHVCLQSQQLRMEGHGAALRT